MIEEVVITMKYIDDFEKRISRYDAFWQGEFTDRCLMSVIAPKTTGYVEEKVPTSDKKDIYDYWTNPERITKRFRHMIENSYYAGDALPIMNFNIGACSHAGFFKGAKWEYRDSLWFFPSIENLATEIPEFDENAILYKKALEMTDYFAKECKDEFFISIPDNVGSMDVLSHLRGADLMFDMVDQPEAVHRALVEVQKVWELINNHCLEVLGKANNGATCIGWLRTYAKGRHAQLQCDIACMLSADMFREFCLPELNAQAKLLDHALYHFDGIEQIRMLDMILSVENLNTIQWTCVAGQPSPLEFIPVLKKIQQAGKNLLIIIKPEELEGILTNLSAKGLFLVINASSKDEADDLVKLADKLSCE